MIAPLGFRMLHTSVDPFNFDPAYIAQVQKDCTHTVCMKHSVLLDICCYETPFGACDLCRSLLTSRMPMRTESYWGFTFFCK
jgi:hypothetical protein